MNDRIFNFDSRQRNVDWNGKKKSPVETNQKV